MRKLLLLIAVLLAFQYARPATALYHPQWPPLKLSTCTKVSIKDMEKLTGKKLSFIQRISFHLMKSKMKRALRKDPDLTLDQFMQSGKKSSEPVSTGLIIFAIVGLVLVILLIVLHRSYDP